MKNHFSAQAFMMRRLKYSARSFLLIVSLLCLLSGITGIIFLQNNQTSQNFDTRRQASETEMLEVISPEANASIDIDQNTTESFTIQAIQQSLTQPILFSS